MARDAWRIVFISTVPPVVQSFVPLLRELGHEPVAVISARRRRPVPERPSISDETVPAELDIHVPNHRRAVEPILRVHRPDLVITWGYPWRIPASALAIPRLGGINLHPALLPRHRGPIPLAWAIRDGDAAFGVTWHRMDDRFDTGPILAQASVPILATDTSIGEVGPRLGAAAASLLPRVLERLAADDPGDAQSEEGATWAGFFEEDYAAVDWSESAEAIHRQVRAWQLAMGTGPVVGPVVELDGVRRRLTRTSLEEPAEGGRREVCGDGRPLWILETEPMDPPPQAA